MHTSLVSSPLWKRPDGRSTRRSPHCPAQSRQLKVLAASDSSKQPPRGGFFHNKKEQEAQDAARRSLEGMFKGKKDILASFDSSSGRGSGGGGGKKITGGGGNGSGWQPPNWRDLGTQFGKHAWGLGKAMTAIMVFAGAIMLIPVLPQVVALVLGAIRSILRLDGRNLSGRRQYSTDPTIFAGTSNLGPHESAVIGKYGGATDSAR